MRTCLAIGLLTISLTFAGTLLAQPGDTSSTEHPFKHRRHADGDGVHRLAQIMFLQRADSDQSGTVSAAEWDAMVAKIGEGFAELDDDGDGSVDVPTRSSRAFTRSGSSGRGGRGGRFPHRLRQHGRHAAGMGLMRAADRTGDDDGTLTRDEWQQFLTDTDTNFDGSLGFSEIAEALRANRPEGSEPRESSSPTIEQLLERFDSIDTNGDGELGEDERPSHHRHHHRDAE